jgi:hypothetical protein
MMPAHNTFRVTILVLAAIAALSFSYNQIAQARSVRYRPLSSEVRAMFDSWDGTICRAGRCSAYFREREQPSPAETQRTHSPPAQMDTGMNLDTTR